MEENNGSRIEILLVEVRVHLNRVRAARLHGWGFSCTDPVALYVVLETSASSIWPWDGFLKSIVGPCQGSPKVNLGSRGNAMLGVKASVIQLIQEKIWCLPWKTKPWSHWLRILPTLWRPSLHLTFVSHTFPLPWPPDEGGCQILSSSMFYIPEQICYWGTDVGAPCLE